MGENLNGSKKICSTFTTSMAFLLCSCCVLVWWSLVVVQTVFPNSSRCPPEIIAQSALREMRTLHLVSSRIQMEERVRCAIIDVYIGDK